METVRGELTSSVRDGRIAFEIEDDRLRAPPISAIFDAYDSDAFAAFLATLNGVVVRRTPTRIVVLRAVSGDPEPDSEAR
jgi:hypothetical protein